jgi:leader peptidase (prepilin peptidase) / N-methyltransferase
MIYFFLVFVFVIFLCWGSFLNVVAYRSLSDIPFFTKRSYCPSCSTRLAWYDEIPIISWLFLKARCRTCAAKISVLYPFIELTSAIVFTFLYFSFFSFDGLFLEKQSTISFAAYFIFFSALIVATRTDLEGLVIPQIFSLWLAPVGVAFSYFGFLKIGFYESLFGAIGGYLCLWVVAKLFKLIAKKEGLGVGDMELLALIGAFLGPLGIWFCLMAASFSGLLVAGLYLLIISKKGVGAKIPFAPFLAFGAVLYFFLESYFKYYFLGI